MADVEHEADNQIRPPVSKISAFSAARFLRAARNFSLAAKHGEPHEQRRNPSHYCIQCGAAKS
jgi:hypothetical protein